MKRKINKIVKKTNKSILVCIILFFIIGFVGGYATIFMFTQNDTFEIVGDKNITLNLNQEYIEQGAKAISFSKDISQNIKIETDLDISKEGEYIVIYTVKDSFKYKDIKRVRYVTVTNGSDTNE